MKLTTALSAVILFMSPGLGATDKPTPPAAPAKPAPPVPPAPAAPAANPTPPAAPAVKLPKPPRPWKSMSAQQRGKYMKDVVTPRMKVAFQQFDADLFDKFGCDTCHGENAKARKFKMPNPDMYVLPSTPAGFGPLMERKPKMMKFMAEVVKPQMAAMLGLPEFDPKKPEAGGFGCTGCHTSK